MILYEGLNNLTWFMGIVQRINDPKHEGRVKVRAFGFHPTIAEGTVTADDLPWATVLINNVSVSAKLAIGELVFGAFLDGRDAQQPLIFGVIPTPKFGIPTLEPAGPVGDGRVFGQTGSSNLAANYAATGTQDAFLNAIALKESGGNYNILNGGQIISDLTSQPHPNIVGEGGLSTAAGKYQFTYATWLDINNGVNVPMTKANQDAAAWALAEQRYNRYTGGNDLTSYLETNGVTSELLTTLAPTWEAFSSSRNQSEIIDVYNNSLAAGSAQAPAGMELPATAPYTPLVSETIASYGQGALPPQRTGEGIHHTPLAPALASFQRERSPVIHPGLAVGSSYNTTVINASYNGSYIEMHGGDGENNEHINIVHKSGAHIALDQNGNVTIGAIGRLHVVSLNDFEQQIGGHTTNISDGGYSIRVENGGIQLHSVGDLSISSNSNINIAAAGDIVLNSGTSLDISSARVGLSATAGGVGVLSSEGIQLQSVGDTTVKGANFVVNAGTVGMEATGGNATIKGTQVRLNDGSVPAVAGTQGAVGVEKPPTVGIATKREPSRTSGGISANQIDDPISS